MSTPAFQPVSEHIDRVFDSALSVDLKILHEGMENLVLQFECPGDFRLPEDAPLGLSCSGPLIPTTPVGRNLIAPRRCRILMSLISAPASVPAH